MHAFTVNDFFNQRQGNISDMLKNLQVHSAAQGTGLKEAVTRIAVCPPKKTRLFHGKNL